MVSTEVARTTIGILGNIISLVLFLSPVVTFVQIWKKGSVEQFSAMPYLATLLNCGMWLLYGLPVFHPNSLLVLTINGSGFAIEVVYLVLYLWYSRGYERKKVGGIMAAELVVIGMVGLLVATLVHSLKLRTTIIGSICMVGCFLMYAAPLSIMRMVIRTKSVKYMPFLLSLFSFLNGLCWASYALIRLDPYLLAPNVLGLLLGAAQLILYATYYKSTKRQLAAKQTEAEVGLPDFVPPPTISTDSKKLAVLPA